MMPLRRPGCKETLKRKLLRLLPMHVTEFRDATVGNGPLLPFVHADRIIANDMDATLMDYYKSLKSCPLFIPQVLDLREQARCPKRRRQIFEEMKPRYLAGDGLALLYLSRHAFRELVRAGRSNTASFDQLKTGLQPVTHARLLRARAALRNVELVCGDYRPILARPGRDVAIFLDPPYYLPDTHDPLFEHSWVSEKPFHELKAALESCPHRFLLTLGDSDLENDLFRSNGWDVRALPYTTHSVKGTHKAAERRHLVIRNFRTSRERLVSYS